MTQRFSSMLGNEQGNIMMVVGAGGSLRTYKKSLCDLVTEHLISTIGINNMTNVLVPKYHLWTNSGRLRKFHSCINESSIVIFGSQVKKDLIKKCYSKKHVVVDYRDKRGLPVSYKNGIIRGFFRTAGCLSIIMCKLLGASKIYVAGMDGYTLHYESDVNKGLQNQHVYGSGFTDGTTWKTCKQKDDIVCQALRDLKNFGADFQIITPTVFSEFYTERILRKSP